MAGFEFSSVLVCIRFPDYILSTKGTPSRSHWLHSQAYCAGIRLCFWRCNSWEAVELKCFHHLYSQGLVVLGGGGRVDLIETNLFLPPPLPLGVSLLSFIYALTRIVIYAYIQLILNNTPSVPPPPCYSSSTASPSCLHILSILTHHWQPPEFSYVLPGG